MRTIRCKGETNTHGPGRTTCPPATPWTGFQHGSLGDVCALGSEDQSPPATWPYRIHGAAANSVNNWAPGFLPAAFQGTDFNATKPIGISPSWRDFDADQATRRFLRELNERHAERFPGWRLAARDRQLRTGGPDATHDSRSCRSFHEPAHILRLYGADGAGIRIPICGRPTRETASRPGGWWRGRSCPVVPTGAYQTGGGGRQQLGRSARELFQQYRRPMVPCRPADGGTAPRPEAAGA